jgi:hypothetical protein
MVPVKGLGAVLSMLLMAACATDSETPRRGTDPMGELIGREVIEEGPKALPPGPAPSNFLGQDIGLLERRIGQAALVRREGNGEFRRYDLPRCRVYAIRELRGGTVTTLSTGPIVTGDAAPDFRTCTSGL